MTIFDKDLIFDPDFQRGFITGAILYTLYHFRRFIFFSGVFLFLIFNILICTGIFL